MAHQLTDAEQALLLPVLGERPVHQLGEGDGTHNITHMYDLQPILSFFSIASAALERNLGEDAINASRVLVAPAVERSPQLFALFQRPGVDGAPLAADREGAP